MTGVREGVIDLISSQFISPLDKRGYNPLENSLSNSWNKVETVD